MRRKVLLVFAVCFFFSSMAMMPLTLEGNASSDDEYIYLIWVSGSMVPTFELGDILTVRTIINASQIYASPKPNGDILVFWHWSPGRGLEHWVHRAVENFTTPDGKRYLRTRGDANYGADTHYNITTGAVLPGLPKEYVVGKVVAFSRKFYAGIWDGIAYNVTIYTNSTIANFNFSQSDKQIEFDITGYISQADNGFCNVTIPKSLLYCSALYDWQIRLNDAIISYTPTQNDTHTFLYFTHDYSIQNVQIIGTYVIGLRLPTSVAISTTASSTVVGFRVDIYGTLCDAYGSGLQNQTVVLYYSVQGTSVWVLLTSDVTDDVGHYYVQWIPSATGYFIIKAEYAGNYTHSKTSNTITFSVIPYQLTVFSVESNSTISALAFNSTSWELSFTTNGPSGTIGYAKVSIAKSLVTNITDIKVYIDGDQSEYSMTSVDDSWLLVFSYAHSIHEIIVIIPEFPSFLILPLFIIAALLAVIVYRRKHF